MREVEAAANADPQAPKVQALANGLNSQPVTVINSTKLADSIKNVFQREVGEEHPDVATSLNNLASLYKSQGGCSEAEPLYIQALDILERRLGVNHPNTLACRKNLADLRVS